MAWRPSKNRGWSWVWGAAEGQWRPMPGSSVHKHNCTHEHACLTEIILHTAQFPSPSGAGLLITTTSIISQWSAVGGVRTVQDIFRRGRKGTQPREAVITTMLKAPREAVYPKALSLVHAHWGISEYWNASTSAIGAASIVSLVICIDA